MIYNRFRSTGANQVVQSLSGLFSLRSQNDDVQHFHIRWDQAPFSSNDIPLDMIFEGLYNSELQASAQLQTMLVLYDQETIRNNGQPSFTKLKTSVSLHIDQMMRNENFKIRNEIVERGAKTKSYKGKNANVERKVGVCYQWRANWQCSKGESCGFRHGQALGNIGILSGVMIKHLETDAWTIGQKDNLPLPRQMRGLGPTVRHSLKDQAAEVRALQRKRQVPMPMSRRVYESVRMPIWRKMPFPTC